MVNKNKLSRIALAVAMSVGLSSAAFAQETSSGISGKIVGPQGNPAAGTTVTITHVASGSKRTVTANASGSFSAKGLRVGGPYSVSIDSSQFQDTIVNDVFLSLGNPYSLNVALEAEQAIEQIVVTASALSTSAFGATGPNANFNLDDLENAPAINRDINDLIRQDPRIFIDESNSNAVQCGGANPRYNSLTVDGVKMNDNFGLNSNGYPTENMPFSYDAIAQVAVELAPFDVQYGGFTACNINAVTKSGTNEIHGGLFYDYSSDSLKGDKLEGEDIDTGDYTQKRYGFNVGLPLIEDTLFLYTAYEEKKGVNILQYGGNAISAGEIAEIRSIASNLYNMDIGTQPGAVPADDEKLLVKLDWNINDNHRASLVYNYNDGFRINQSDRYSRAHVFSSTFYERGAEINSLVGSLYSDWSDDFSTEIRIGRTELDNRQISQDGDTGFGEVRIALPGGDVFFGPDDSRQSNDLDWENFTIKLAGTYYLDEHTITGGFEHETLEVFNLFMQHTVGEYRFSSIADFEAGTPARIYYNNSAGTNNPNDVAATFEYGSNAAYIQDEFYLTDDIKVMAGLRYEWYTGSDKPRDNPNFERRYGFKNNGNLDGVDLLQPRVGFTWEAADDFEVRGGVGLYSGGNPNVWISNNFSNDGRVQIGLQDRSGNSLFDVDLSGEGVPLKNVPQHLVDTVASSPAEGGDGFGVNALDPNFEIPSEWKYALGFTWITENDYLVTADLLHTRKQDSAIIRDIALQESGEFAPDGRPLIERKPLTAADGGTETRSGTYLLTNAFDDGESTTLSLSLSKEFDNGFDFSASYAFTESEDVNPMTSAVAGSNYGNIAVTNPLDPGLSTSDYEVPHRFTFKLGYKTELFDGYDTRFTLFAQANEGRPYSLTYNRSDRAFGDSSWHGSRQLLYIPTEDDANVIYGDDFDLNAFNTWVASEGLEQYRGQIVPRNSQNAEWWLKMDLRVEQQLPGFYEGHKGSVFFTIKNLGNLINDDWGILKQGSFVSERVIGASINDDGKYEYNSFAYPAELAVNDPSLWEVNIGVKYTF